MQEVSGSTPLSSTIGPFKRCVRLEGPATFLTIPDPAQPSLVLRTDIKNGLYSEA